MNSFAAPLTPLRVSQMPRHSTMRLFSTTPSFSLQHDAALARKHQKIATYPYPAARWYKQSNFGLYAGRRLRFGNNVSEKTEIKTRRKWEPNVRYKRLYSQILNKMIRIRVVTRVLRTVDKVGGLDNYLLGDKAHRIRELGMGGWALRWRLMQTETVRERMRIEREKLGLEGKAPWEIRSREEALSEGFSPEIMGMTAEDAEEIARGIDKVLDKDEELGEEGGISLTDEELDEQSLPPEGSREAIAEASTIGNAANSRRESVNVLNG